MHQIPGFSNEMHHFCLTLAGLVRWSIGTAWLVRFQAHTPSKTPTASEVRRTERLGEGVREGVSEFLVNL